MIFKTITNEAGEASFQVTKLFSNIRNLFSNTPNISSFELSSNLFESLETDTQALLAYKDACEKGIPPTQAFDSFMREASFSAKEYAKSVNFATITEKDFDTYLRKSDIALQATDKSFANCKVIIDEYATGLEKCGLEQNDYIDAVRQSNPKLAKYLSTVKQGEASFSGYVKSLVATKASTIALQAATMALNAIIGFGISALLSWATNAISEAYVSASELADKVDELTSNYKEQHDALIKMKGDYDTSDANSMISRYEKLSKGVNALGENISLTTDEYAEYQNIVDTIAEQIPNLIAGYDAQGKSILKCKDDVNELTEAYHNLVLETNDAVLAAGEDVFKVYQNKIAEANKSGFWDSLFDNNKELTDSGYNALKNILKSNDIDKAIDEYAPLGSTAAVELNNAFKDAGIKQDADESGTEYIKRVLTKHKGIAASIISNYNSILEANIDDIKSLTEAYFSTAFLTDYSDIDEFGQNIINQMVSGFDVDFYSQFNSVDEMYSKFQEMLDGIRNLDEDTVKNLEAAFDLQTQFNGGDIPFSKYVEGLQNASDLIDTLELSDEVKTQIKLALNTEEVIGEYDSLMARLTGYSKDENGMR